MAAAHIFDGQMAYSWCKYKRSHSWNTHTISHLPIPVHRQHQSLFGIRRCRYIESLHPHTEHIRPVWKMNSEFFSLAHFLLQMAGSRSRSLHYLCVVCNCHWNDDENWTNMRNIKLFIKYYTFCVCVHALYGWEDEASPQHFLWPHLLWSLSIKAQYNVHHVGI